MSSILPGFEYDIFISYRQRDNKYDGWVNELSTQFVKIEDALRYTSQAIDRHDPLFPMTAEGRPDNKTFRSIPKIVEIIKSSGLY